MMGYGYGGMDAMWPWMMGWMIGWSVLLLAGVGALVWAVVRLAQGRPGGGAGDGGSARRILDERYARGEIGDEEYSARRKALG